MAVIPFEPQLFGTAANNGQMIAEIVAEPSDRRDVPRNWRRSLTGRAEAKKHAQRACSSPLIDKLLQRRAKRWLTSVRSSSSCSESVTAPLGSAARAAAPLRLHPAPPPAPAGAAPRRPTASRRRPRADSLRRPRRAARRRAGAAADRGARTAAVDTPAIDSRRSETYYETKSTIFGALIEAIDLAQLAKLDAESAREEIRDIVNEIIAIKNIVMSISEQEELLDDICNDVLGYGPLEPLLARDDIADIMVNGSGTVYIEVDGQDPEDRHPLPRQPAAAQHLPAHRQPDRPARRRILADLRRAPAGRLARQRHRAAARHRRAGAHHPQVQEGQADARPAGQVRLDHAGRRRDPQGHRPLPRQHAGLRRHRLGQDHAAQLPDPVHRRRRAHHHLRGRRRTAAAAAARGAPGNAAAQPRRRRPDHHARPGQELPAHAAGAHHRRRSARTRGVRPAAGHEHRPRRLDGHAARQLRRAKPVASRIDDHHGRLFAALAHHPRDDLRLDRRDRSRRRACATARAASPTSPR